MPSSPSEVSNPNEEGDEQQTKATDDAKPPSKIKQLWTKLGLDIPTVLLMMKAAIPPTISLAIYQADSVAKTYSTLGYLVAIVSILGFCIMPRAKFIQTMALNVISTCVGTAVALLMIWSSIQARKHTTPAGRPMAGYNSSQSAVCAIWLFFQIYLVNAIKAKFPQFAFPTIIYAIFVNVAATYGPIFGTMAQGISFAKRLLEAFLTGFAISTVVSLVIIPTTCRMVIFKEITGYVGLLRGALQAHKAYIRSLESTDMFASIRIEQDGKDKNVKKSRHNPEVETLKTIISAISDLHGKLHSDLPFAKREIAYGKLGPDALTEISKHLRAIMIPMLGLSSLVDIFGRIAEMNNWNTDPEPEVADPESEARRKQAVSEWNEIMTSVHEPFSNIIQVMDQGLEHVLFTLELAKPPKMKKGLASTNEDVEAKGDTIKPGDKGFADYLDKQSEDFYQGKEMALRVWCERKGIKLAQDFFEHPSTADYVEAEEMNDVTSKAHERNQRQLYLLLYMEFLIYSISRAVLSFVRYADKQVADGNMAKSKLLLPGNRRLRKWLTSVFQVEDATHDDTATTADLDGNNTVIYLGEAYKSRKDPEHLPPENFWQRMGDCIRAFPRFLRSSESSFGFRCACATMSIALVAYLHDTQVFFMEQRLVWAMIMVAISMTPTAGQSVYSFVLRIFGTFLAMIIAFCIWYIPDEKTAGILVFLWFFVACGFYVPLKQPRFVMVGIISVVTATLIIGYELEVRKIGKNAATSNSQPYYAIYLLGPYRLATVVGGLAVAFIWTFFPYPISEHSVLRQTLGASLYLSANYYSIVSETVRARIRGDEGDLELKGSPGHKLEKARNKVFAKQVLLLDGLRTYSGFLKWEIPIGGKFPKKEYNIIIQCVSNISNYTSLLSYASRTFTDPSFNNQEGESENEWFEDFRRLMSSISVRSHEITSLLCLLSSSVANGQPLPPYLTAPKAYQLSAKMEALDKDILSIRHIAEPGYAAFAVIQISTRCIIVDLEKLLTNVKSLVGELDFSFHTVSTTNSSETSSNDTLFQSTSRRNKQD
ncbi:MFS transporter [Lepidopterella palustris CBS 459.81]|uniref:MFS transporter n=1 Tax=Lepidopterella palustris CBS 459.81 TaxID=1314670 RepID=A0A8E2EAM0_9PEZI|nr:MFS transporter [Lepidopterella palustris CBS 459.81]